MEATITLTFETVEALATFLENNQIENGVINQVNKSVSIKKASLYQQLVGSDKATKIVYT